MSSGGLQGACGFPLSQYLLQKSCFCGRNARMSACLVSLELPLPKKRHHRSICTQNTSVFSPQNQALERVSLGQGVSTPRISCNQTISRVFFCFCFCFVFYYCFKCVIEYSGFMGNAELGTAGQSRYTISPSSNTELL